MTSVVYFEDDELSRQVMDLFLRRMLGFTEVAIFADSSDFQAKVEALPYKPDVIFVDIHMLPHDGFKVLKVLRKVESLNGTRIVAITASVMNEEVQMLREAGFDGVIGKPLDRELFPDLLRRILRGEKVWRPT